MRSFVSLYVVVVLCVIGSVAGQAQTSGQEYSADGVVIGRTLTSLSIPAPTKAAGTPFAKGSGSDMEIIDEVVWMSFNAGTDSAFVGVRILPESIRFIGNCDSADQVPTSEIFRSLAETALSQGIAQGYILCTPDGTRARVLTPACVQRLGSNCDTRFQACDSTRYAIHDYLVKCTSEGATITPIYSWTPGCGDISCQPASW
jgi:hypothetical protein